MKIFKKILEWLGFYPEPEKTPECIGDFIPHPRREQCSNCYFRDDCEWLTGGQDAAPRQDH